MLGSNSIADSWANLQGLDLHLEPAGPGLRAGLEEALRDAVRSGRLPAGARLPSSRALAGDLGLSRNTIAHAYGQLVAEGWLVARTGSGTRVAERVPAAEPSTSPEQPERPRLRYDLRAGTPDLTAFPRSAWLAAARRALNAAAPEVLGYTDPAGLPELRQALAGYLGRARGVSASADRIVVCSGFTQGLSLLCQVLRARGATSFAMEAYAHRRHRDAIAAHGFRLRALPVDSGGASVDLGDADAALLTPAHQFPLGTTLAPARRTRAVEWAHDGGGLLIEDDYDGEFRYDRRPVGAMQALAPEHVVYAGTASKALAPGLRLGWLVLPSHLIDEVTDVKARSDWHTSSLDQLALAELIAGGEYDRHIRRSRLAYRRRRDRLSAALADDGSGVGIAGTAAGLHALLELPDGRSEAELVARAAGRGLAVEGLGDYRVGEHRHGPALVVGYATPPEHAFTAALARLTATLAA